LAEFKFETTAAGAKPSPFRASFAFAEPPPDASAAAAVKSSRRRMCVTLQARRCRATFSLDSGFALALAALTLACLLSRAAAYTVLPASPRALRPLSASSYAATWDRAAAAASAPLPPAGPLAAASAGFLDDPVAVASASLQRATRYLSPPEARTVADAVAFAVVAHAGQFRKSGEPYVVHPIETACILAEMRVDADTVCAPFKSQRRTTTQTPRLLLNLF
jgi:hypothetical protein